MSTVFDHPGPRRLRSGVVEEQEQGHRYQLVRVQFPFDTSQVGSRLRSNKTQVFNAPGDHLHLLELTGAEAIAVSTQVGARGNPFIPVQEGDTITRKFQQFAVRNLSDRLLDAAPTGFMTQRVTAEALFLISTGPVIHRWRKPQGMSAGFLPTRLTATATGIDVFDAIRQAWGNAGAPLGVRFGGTVMLHNLSPGATIYFGYGVAGGFVSGLAVNAGLTEANMWELLPGDRWEFYAEGRLHTAQRPRGVLGPQTTLIAAVTAGTADFKILLPRVHTDASDEDSLAFASSESPVQGLEP